MLFTTHASILAQVWVCMTDLTDYKVAKNTNSAWDLQETYQGRPHSWIQWKGTHVCMDVYCICGYHSHVHGEFAYHVKCPKCDRVYMCNGHIELILLEKEPANCVVMDDNPVDDK